jgi:hypothetical protein
VPAGLGGLRTGRLERMMAATQCKSRKNFSKFMKTVFALCLLVIISQSADQAGAEACRYSENRHSFLRLLRLFAATVLFELL